jgi:hypothetical protein
MAKASTKVAPRAKPTPKPEVTTNKTAVLVPLDSLVPYDKNPRDNSAAVDAVAASIKEYGFLVPIVVDKDNVIVAGHTRYAASVKLNLSEVPVLVADHLTERQVQAFRLIDNKTAELATWDFDLLAGEVSELMDSGIDLVAFGWSQEEVDCLADLVGSTALSDGLDEDAGDDDIVNRHANDGVNSAVQANKGSSVVSKDPKSVRVAVGEINFFVDIELYRNWAHEIRKANGFDMGRVVAHLSGLLGLEARPMNRTPKQIEQEKAEAAKAIEEEVKATGRTRQAVVREAAINRRRPAPPKTAEHTLRDAVDAAEA